MKSGARQRFSKVGALALAPQAWGGEFDAIVVGEDAAAFAVEGDAAVVDICGPLLCRAEGFFGLFFDSYPAIRARVKAACASSAKAVVLRFDSPGGDVAGCFELARELRAMAQAAGKPLVAYVDAMAASAAYALACSADEIVVSATGMVGSVGVINALADQVELDRAMGLNVVVVASGARKADGNPHVAITEEAVNAMKAHVDELAGIFFALVEELRGVPSASTQALDGGVFYGASATSAGLADRVSTWTDMLAGITAGDRTETSMNPKASKYDEAVGALRAAAEGDDEDAKKAKQALKAIDSDGDDDGDKKKAEDEKKDAEAKAAAKAKAEDDEKKDAEAKALAASNLELARQVQELRAADARRSAAEAAAKDEQARASLFAKRPDVTGAVKQAFAKLPLADLATALEGLPRVSASAGAAAAAMTPDATADAAKAYVPKLSAEEQELFDKVDRKTATSKAATTRGTVHAMPMSISREDAIKRRDELAKQLAKETV